MPFYSLRMGSRLGDIVDTVTERFLPGRCRCCLENGKFIKTHNSLNCQTNFKGDTFAEMLRLCFALDILDASVPETDSYICDLCILRLRDAFDFKNQIEKAQIDLKITLNGAIKEDAENTISLQDKDTESDEWDMYEPVDAAEIRNDKKEKFEKLLDDKRYLSERREQRLLLSKVCKDTLTCLICQERFLNTYLLNRHLNVHYPNYKCDLCGKAFATRKRVTVHLRYHATGDNKCNGCDMTYDSVIGLRNHYTKIHQNALRNCCPKCPERFKDFYDRYKHLVAVHGMPKNPYKCKQCNMGFGLTAHLKTHVRRVHLKERDKICSVCGMRFFANKELYDHMLTHTGERAFTCEVCKKSFARRKTLKEHLRIHADDRRFLCNICKRSFVQKCSLKSHMKTHLNDKSTLKNVENSHESVNTFIRTDVEDNKAA